MESTSRARPPQEHTRQLHDTGAGVYPLCIESRSTERGLSVWHRDCSIPAPRSLFPTTANRRETGAPSHGSRSDLTAGLPKEGARCARSPRRDLNELRNRRILMRQMMSRFLVRRLAAPALILFLPVPAAPDA